MKKKILIVEDDKQIASMLAICVKLADYEPIVAYDAVQALSLGRRHYPKLIVLDITMPGGNGFLVAEWLQELHETSGVPIIFITANTQPSVREAASEYGAVAFFEKPFEPKDLLAAIDGALALTVGDGPGQN